MKTKASRMPITGAAGTTHEAQYSSASIGGYIQVPHEGSDNEKHKQRTQGRTPLLVMEKLGSRERCRVVGMATPC